MREPVLSMKHLLFLSTMKNIIWNVPRIISFTYRPWSGHVYSPRILRLLGKLLGKYMNQTKNRLWGVGGCVSWLIADVRQYTDFTPRECGMNRAEAQREGFGNLEISKCSQNINLFEWSLLQDQ